MLVLGVFEGNLVVVEPRRKTLLRHANVDSCVTGCGSRDFKTWYGEAVVRRQIVKITSGDVMTRDPLRFARRILAFYYGKVPSFTYSSLRE